MSLLPRARAGAALPSGQPPVHRKTPEEFAPVARRRKRQRRSIGDRCRFCRDKVESISYKDVDELQRLMSSEASMFGRKRSGNCSKHQRMVKRAVKRARFLALLPYT
jgi:small subunit ribosomal protein S18